jgi:hypothetical protein
MKTANLASIRVVVPKLNAQGNPEGITLALIGMAQNISISDNFNTRPVNVLGSPLPIIVPGFMSSSISIEKATVDGVSFHTLGAFNPLWASVGSSYSTGRVKINSSQEVDGMELDGNSGGPTTMMPFMFIVAVKDKVSQSYEDGSLTPVGLAAGTESTSLVGTYACVLNDARVSLTSANSVIMDSITATARPLSGAWMGKAMKAALHSQGGDATGAGKNGMTDYVNAMTFGYDS